LGPPNQDPREIERLWQSLREDLRKRGADPHTAEDVVQEAWLRAMERPPEDRGRFSGWLHVVAVRLLYRTRKLNGARAHVELSSARPDRVPMEVAHEESTLLRFVDELPNDVRTVVQMRFVHDLEVPEIARRLEMQPQTVHVRLRRGLDLLRHRVGDVRDSRERLLSLAALRNWFRGASWSSRLVRSALVLGCVAMLFGVVLLRSSTSAADRGAISVDVAVAADAPPLVSALVVEPAPAPDSRAEVPSVAGGSSRPRIRGFVRTPDGASLPGAEVHAAAADGSGASRTVVADDTGRYEIDAARGDVLWATEPRWLESPRCYVSSLLSAELEELDLHVGRTRGRTLIHVVDSEGVPVAGARVLLDPFRRALQTASGPGVLEYPAPPRTVTTDAGGNAEFLFPDRALLELVVLPEDLPGWNGEVAASRAGEPLTIQLPAALALVGTCVYSSGEPAAEAKVEALQLGGLVRRVARTAPDGTFRVEGLVEGEYVLQAAEDRALGSASAWCQKSVKAGAVKKVALVLGPDTTLTGFVVDHRRPVPGVTVELKSARTHVSEGEAKRTTLTDERGQFVFTALRPNGRYMAGVRCPRGPGPSTEVAPGQQGIVLELNAEAAEAPVVLHFEGEPEALPRMVELRTEPRFSLVLEVEPGSDLARSVPLRAGSYTVFGWNPMVGSWLVDRIEHDPGASSTPEIHVPSPGVLTVTLDLPPAVRPQDVEVLVSAARFDAYGFGQEGPPGGWRTVEWREDTRKYVCRMPPGENDVLVRGAGRAELSARVRVRAGEDATIHLAPLPGTYVSLVLKCDRELVLYEKIHIDAVTPFGGSRRTIPPAEQRAIRDGYTADVWLPVSATELNVVTEKRDAIASPMAGHRSIAVGELDAAAPGRQIVVELREEPR
jgi:RNA polymerase sigma factor (sigma-70 family)